MEQPAIGFQVVSVHSMLEFWAIGFLPVSRSLELHRARKWLLLDRRARVPPIHAAPCVPTEQGVLDLTAGEARRRDRRLDAVVGIEHLRSVERAEHRPL